MAGSDPRFPLAIVKDALQFAMRMGSANDVTKRATFRWTKQTTWVTADPAGVPYDLNATPTAVVAKADVVLEECAIEFQPRAIGSRTTSVGEFNPSLAVVTLLDTDYAKVVDADELILDGDTYYYKFEAPVQGLFDLDVHTVYFQAEDES